MIHRIYSTLPSFKEVVLRPGLNLIVAEKAEQSGAKQTRNRAGKTSLILIVHFLLGGEGHPASIFRKPELEEHEFAAEMDISGATVRITRCGKTFGDIGLEIVTGSTLEWPVNPFVDETTITLTSNAWRKLLGRVVYNIPPETGTYGPKFGSLFNYFARRADEGAMIEPQSQSKRQLPWDQQVAVSYIIGLDWELSQRREVLRQRETELKKLRRAAKDGILSEIFGDPKQIRTQLALEENKIARLREAIETFTILPDYHEREQEATALTRRMNVLSDANQQDSYLIDNIDQILQTEQPPPMSDLEQVYNEVGVVLPDAALRRYEEVRVFHESVLQNRRLHLLEERSEAEERMAKRSRELSRLEAPRRDIMVLLRTHGALDHFSVLQSDLSRAEARGEQIRQKHILAEELLGKSTELNIEKQQLFLRLQQNFREHDDEINNAILSFESASESLYEEAGNLAIYPSEGGPKFEVTIQGQKSRGVQNMQIFCFDMMLMQIATQRGMSLGFLIHDSHLFDPVDERQTEMALQYGTQKADELGIQYIVTMNTDQLPHERVTDFPLEEYILDIGLTDETEEGGLFGFRF